MLRLVLNFADAIQSHFVGSKNLTMLLMLREIEFFRQPAKKANRAGEIASRALNR